MGVIWNPSRGYTMSHNGFQIARRSNVSYETRASNFWNDNIKNSHLFMVGSV